MTRKAFAVLALAMPLIGGTTPSDAQPAPYDVVIAGGKIIDGTGNPWFTGDIGIRGDAIAAIAPHLNPAGARVVSAAGLAVSPGFIDVHSHSENSAAGAGLAGNPLAENNLRQGVTTVFANPDGGGEIPIAPFLARIGTAKPAINLGAFIGHGAIREKILGRENRAATSAEIDGMRALVRQGMEDGAFGLSTGLFYVPANYAPTAEVIELAMVAGLYGGIHQSHMRDEASRVLESVGETIAIGEQGRLPTQITHHKIIGKAYWGRSADTLRLLDEARARGVDVTIDQYPYTASSTRFDAALIPQWAQEGGRAAMLMRLQNPEIRARVRTEIAGIIDNERGGGDPANVMLTACDFDPALAGKNLSELLRARGRPATSSAAADLVVEIVEKGECQAVFHAISDDDLVRIMRHPATMIASDAFPGEPEFGRDVPHPRAYGTFARVLGYYVRERRVLTLEEAVRKMSSLPAARMRLTDRGILRAGMKADLVVFDPATIKDTATFEKPHQYAIGVRDVVVNGEFVLDGGKATDKRPGRVLRGPGYRIPP
jgi:N-acyl-D-amino-acid deacylase